VFLPRHSESNAQSRFLRKQSCPGTVDSVGRCFSQASKLFEICQDLFLQVSFQNDALSQVMLWPYLPQGYTATQRNSRRTPKRFTGVVPFRRGRPPRPFADLIYGAILMPKNIPRAPCVPPRDSKRFLAFPDSLTFSFFIVLSLVSVSSLLNRCVCEYRVLAHPQSMCCYLRWTFAEKSILISHVCVCVYTYTCVNTFDVSYDRMQLNCRYKSIKSWVSCVPRAFQPSSFAELRTKPTLYISPESSKYDLSFPVACTLLLVILAVSLRFFRPTKG